MRTSSIHTANPIREVGAIDPIAVTEQIPGRRVVGERFHDLPGCPPRRRMTCNAEVNDRPSMVPENHKTVLPDPTIAGRALPTAMEVWTPGGKVPGSKSIELPAPAFTEPIASRSVQSPGRGSQPPSSSKMRRSGARNPRASPRS